MNSDPAAVILGYHSATSHLGSEKADPGLPTPPKGFVSMDPENRPTPFKRYPSAERIALPGETSERAAAAGQALSGRGRPAASAFDAELLAQLLFHCAGVTRVARVDGGERVFRAAPAAGNLHPVELYVATPDLGSVTAGLYHYEPREHALERLRPGDRRAAVSAALADADARRAQAALILTGVPWRTGWKYYERGWRHVYWDAGSLAAQLLSMAAALGVRASVRLGFVDTDLVEELGIDGHSEFPVAVVLLGEGAATAELTSGTLLGGEPEAVSPHPFEFPLTVAAQRAGDLGTPEEVVTWRGAASGVRASPGDAVELPPGVSSEESMSDLILRRGSTRFFDRSPLAEDLARWALSVGARPVGGDFCAPDGSLLTHLVSVHSVEGLSPGRYRWVDRGFEPLQGGPEPEVRALSQRLCLGQPLGGESAFTAFHSTALAPLVARLGARGYRAAQFEAGLAAGRLQLAAFAGGVGGTGLTFFDDLVPLAFDSDDACLLVTAVGRPAYRSRAGGGPGQPTEMVGLQKLRDRLLRQLSSVTESDK